MQFLHPIFKELFFKKTNRKLKHIPVLGKHYGRSASQNNNSKCRAGKPVLAITPQSTLICLLKSFSNH